MRNMGKRAFVVVAAMLVAVLAACMLCACQGSSGESSETDEDLPEIKIGADVLEPFFYTGRNGSYVGIDADIMREACRRAGLAPVFVNVPWVERDERLADGSVDCIGSAFAINSREDDYAWTDAYLDTDLAIVVEDRSPSTSLENFTGPGGVAVRANSITEQFFLNGAGLAAPASIEVHSYGSADMAKTAFVKAFTDGWASYKIVLDGFMAEHPGMYRYLDDSLMTLRLGVAFSKSYDGPYRSMLNDAFESMKRDGTIDDIVARYTEDASWEQEAADAQ